MHNTTERTEVAIDRIGIQCNSNLIDVEEE